MSKKENLKIIPLGGLEEIGKNMTVFEYGEDIILLDSGFGFPDDELLGIDIVIPDIAYLRENKERIKGIILTHGHMDHIGSLPFVLKEINVPIYGTKLTLGLVEVRLEEFKDTLDPVELIEIKPDEIFNLGCFEIDPIRVSHSIPDAVGFAIKTPVGVVVHTGDFKIDYTPIDGDMIDLGKFAKYGNEGVLLLMADSTNVMKPGNTMSEMTVVLVTVFDVFFIQYFNFHFVLLSVLALTAEYKKSLWRRCPQTPCPKNGCKKSRWVHLHSKHSLYHCVLNSLCIPPSVCALGP
jgi:ribonuclease J